MLPEQRTIVNKIMSFLQTVRKITIVQKIATIVYHTVSSNKN